MADSNKKIPGFALRLCSTRPRRAFLSFTSRGADRRGPIRAVEFVIADDDSAGFCFAQENV
jgi:hypothetical protein